MQLGASFGFVGRIAVLFSRFIAESLRYPALSESTLQLCLSGSAQEKSLISLLIRIPAGQQRG